MDSTSAVATRTPLHDDPRSLLVCAAATDRGRRRVRNEDRYGVYPDLGLFVVADGIGGAEGGDVAAQMAVEVLYASLTDLAEIPSPGAAPARPSVVSRLVTAVEDANRCVHHTSRVMPTPCEMGTTIAALLACGPRAALAHVGDSRIYRLRGGNLTQLTEDHSLFNELVRRGRIDGSNPRAFTEHHVITRAVGPDPHVDVDARLVDAAPGDTFLLCSDGLSGVLTDEELRDILVANEDLDDTVAELIGRANDQGGPDNVTALVVRWEATSGALREHEPPTLTAAA